MTDQLRSHSAVCRIAPVCILALVLSGCSATSGTSKVAARPIVPPTIARTTAPGAAPTRTSSTASRAFVGRGVVTKVLVFVEENHSLSQMRSGMPYTFSLARRYGYATGYRAIRHPSLPNYVAIAGGQTFGITDDGSPADYPVRSASVFGQAIAARKTAAVYVDGMPGNCATSSGGSSYAVKHNPWAYFTGERASCRRYNVPVGALGGAIARATLPNVGMVVPNECHDAHNCSLGTADAWFKGWMTRILQGPDWKSGHLAVIVTADEDDHSGSNTVLTVVIHPSQRGHVVTAPLTHYSLTRLYEEVTHTRYLFGAASARSMATAFGLPLR